MVIPYLRQCSRPATNVFRTQCRRHSAPAGSAPSIGGRAGGAAATTGLAAAVVGYYLYNKQASPNEEESRPPVPTAISSIIPIVEETAVTTPAEPEPEPAPVEPVIETVKEEIAESEQPEPEPVVAEVVDEDPVVDEPPITLDVVLEEETSPIAAETPPSEAITEEVEVVVVANEVTEEEEEEEVESAVVKEAVAELNQLLDEITPPLPAEGEVQEEEAALDDRILEALQSTDYEPVLSDSILEILVGKAASREKAVVATISRLENAMAGVVGVVQRALQHHNTTAGLVAVAKGHAQAVSEATSKGEAKDVLEQLVESSAAVREAFQVGEAVDAAVRTAFDKLTEVIDKAEQFNLKGPAAAARTLLAKSRQDYFTSCGTAQEHHVDHALLAHYQQSLDNRRKVLDQELAVLRDHFPTRHDSLNATFEAAETSRARVEELNTLITYLSGKVGRLEGALATQQAEELVKLREVAAAQRAEDEAVLEERLKAQAEQLKLQHELAARAEVEAAVAAAREEALRHSERQAELLRAEMTGAAERQIRDLTAFWSDEAALREATVEVECQGRLDRSNRVVERVGELLDAQNGRFAEVLTSRRLLNLSTTLYETANAAGGPDDGKLKESLNCLRSEFSGDPLVDTVTSTLASTISSPLPSFVALSEQLKDLEPRCRRVALVTDSDCGVGSHVASVAMATLTFRDEDYDTKPEDGGCATFYHLSKAQSEMRANNLDMAARHINQMEGEPRSIVAEWLRDARALLELQQSASVLLSYAKLLNHT